MAFDITNIKIIKDSLGVTIVKAVRKGLFDKRWCEDGAIFYEKPKTAGAMRVVKLPSELYDKFKLRYSNDITLKHIENKLNHHITFEIPDSPKFRVEATGKSSGGGGSKVTTDMQERASMWIIRRALARSEVFDTWDDVGKDEEYPKLLKLFPTIENEVKWKKSFMAQNARMFPILKDYSEFKEYSRPKKGLDNFPAFLTRQMKRFPKYNLGTWNPADIWLVKNKKDVKDAITDALAKMNPKHPDVLLLNKVMRQLWKDGDLIGISLKKVTGSSAHWITQNIEKVSMSKRKEYDLVLDSARCHCNLKGTKGNRKLETKEARIFQYEGTTKMYEWQITSNSGSSNYSNLKYEASGATSKAARAGKAPVDRVQETLKFYNKKAGNEHEDYPKNAEQFRANYKLWRSRFLVLKKAKVITRCSTGKEFCNNIIESFESQKTGKEQTGVTTTKLMEVAFLCAVYSIKKKKDRNSFMSEILLHAMKKGFHYGPFGKLY